MLPRRCPQSGAQISAETLRNSARKLIDFNFEMDKSYDFLIIGSGFGGSILALCLAQSGFEVCLVEKGSHPRFAIGESSTPIADIILRDLSERYQLPFLKELSRYGEWQKHHPAVVCGLKRGFSYYPHSRGMEFESDRSHNNELLIAASTDDENSDTNWLRSDVDSYLLHKVKELGVEIFETTEITEAVRNGSFWSILMSSEYEEEKRNCTARWIIDATGSAAFSEKYFGTRSSASGFHTRSSAIYSHFEGAGKWFESLKRNGFYTDDYPYNPDHSALHQLIDEGWIWMLRFNNDLLSAGIVMDNSDLNDVAQDPPDVMWNRIILAYPSISELFKEASTASVPGRIIRSDRLQRRLNTLYGDGWVALNHTAGFVDPLHSTGIAHTLSGVEKLAGIFSTTNNDKILDKKFREMEQIFFRELELIDLLVSSCYLSRKRFDLFAAAVMLYFAATITYEQGRLRGEIPAAFLCADQTDLGSLIKKFHTDFRNVKMDGDLSSADENRLFNEIRKAIEPYNQAGLMDPKRNNMYAHTAIKL